jgi:hypothetical protein
MRRTLAIALVGSGVLTLAAAFMLAGHGIASADHKDSVPTCSTTLGIDHHGVHVINDYVIGEDGTGPGGGEGVEVRGGPGPGFHFEFGFAPGASFCLTESQSPGNHLGP